MVAKTINKKKVEMPNNLLEWDSQKARAPLSNTLY